MAIDCGRARSLMQQYALRELEPGSRGEVDQHLLGCAACRDELAALSVVVSGLDALPVIDAPPGLAGNVLARLPEQRRPLPAAWWLFALAPVAGVLVWLARWPLLRGLLVLGRWFGVTPERLSGIGLPDLSRLTMGHLAIGFAAVAVLGIALSVGGLWLGWHVSKR